MIPLRDVVNYEAHISNDSDVYNKLTWVQAQINTSLEEILNVVSKKYHKHPLNSMGTCVMLYLAKK